MTLTASLVQAQNSNEVARETSRLLALFDNWAKASSDCDYETLAELYHEDVSFWPSVAKKPFYGVEETVDVFRAMCERNPYLNVVPVERYVDLHDDTAVLFGSLTFRKMLNEQISEIPARFSFTLVKEQAAGKREYRWKILHMQSAVVAFGSSANAGSGIENKAANQQ